MGPAFALLVEWMQLGLGAPRECGNIHLSPCRRRACELRAELGDVQGPELSLSQDLGIVSRGGVKTWERVLLVGRREIAVGSFVSPAARRPPPAARPALPRLVSVSA